jgi:hypothetical protein
LLRLAMVWIDIYAQKVMQDSDSCTFDNSRIKSERISGYSSDLEAIQGTPDLLAPWQLII